VNEDGQGGAGTSLLALRLPVRWRTRFVAASGSPAADPGAAGEPLAAVVCDGDLYLSAFFDRWKVTSMGHREPSFVAKVVGRSCGGCDRQIVNRSPSSR